MGTIHVSPETWKLRYGIVTPVVTFRNIHLLVADTDDVRYRLSTHQVHITDNLDVTSSQRRASINTPPLQQKKISWNLYSLIPIQISNSTLLRTLTPTLERDLLVSTRGELLFFRFFPAKTIFSISGSASKIEQPSLSNQGPMLGPVQNTLYIDIVECKTINISWIQLILI